MVRSTVFYDRQRSSRFVSLSLTLRAVLIAFLSDFRLPVASATPGATCGFSAPSPWKRVLQLAVFEDFNAHQPDFQGFVQTRRTVPRVEMQGTGAMRAA